MRYKAYITNSDKIFWTKNSVDKPTKDYFLDLMDTIEWKDLGNITPNFINQFNGSITVDRDDYTYLKLINTETNEIKYYSVDSVNKILNTAYVIEITLDVFATYTMYFYESVVDKPIHVNRTNRVSVYKDQNLSNIHKITIDELMDVKLPLAPLTGKSLNYTFENGYSTPDTNGRTFCFYNMTANEQWRFIRGNSVSNGLAGFVHVKNKIVNVLQTPLFDVFQDVNGDIYYFPIFTNDYLTDDSCFISFFEENAPSKVFYCQNHLRFVEKVKNNTYWVNKYLGRYYIPAWTKLMDAVNYVLVEIKASQYYLFGFYHRGGINTFKAPTNGDLFQYNIPVPSQLSSKVSQTSYTSAHWYLSRAFKTYQDNYTVGELLFNTNPEQTRIRPWQFALSENYNYCFTQTLGAQYFERRKSPFIDMCLSGTETLPTTTNQYTQYIASVQSQQNTNMQVAKQQAIVGGIKSAIGGVLGVAGSIVSGNVVGGISSAVNAVGGIADSVMQYQNQKRQMDAQNADKQRTSNANNFNPTNYVNNYINGSISSTQLIPTGGQTLTKAFSELDIILCLMPNAINKQSKIYLNKVVWQSGFKIDRTINFNTYSNFSFFDTLSYPFIYWDIEVPVEYIKFEYPNYNNELIDAISTTINNPVRFWNQKPDYSLEFNISYFDN